MSAAKSWFVQTGFGTRLGPMPDDALRELVRTGALVRTDQVREVAAEDWQPAGEVLGLFESESPSPSTPTESRSSLVDEEGDTTPAVPTSVTSPTGLIPPAPPVSLRWESEQPIPRSAATTIANAAESPVFEIPAIEPPVVAAITSAPIVDEPAIATPVTAESELINAWKMNRSRSKEDLGMESLADEMTQAQGAEDLAPELPADLFGDESAESSTSVASVSKTSRSSQQRPAFLDQVSGLEAGPRQTVETTRQKWDRWRRSLPSRPIAVILVVAILAAWWLWPRSQRGTYDRYVALWSEWKLRRLDLKDKAGREHFLQHADAELNDIVPWLEKNTRATDHEKKLLLFIGRDCLKKIRKQPWQQGTPHEKQLEFLLAQVHELYEPSAPAAPRNAFIGAKSVSPPKRTPQPEMRNRPLGVVPLRSDPSHLPSEPSIAIPKPTEVSTPP